MTGYLSAFHRT